MEEFFEEDILWPHHESQEENSTEVDPHPAITLSEHTISPPILIPSKVTVSQSWTAGFNYNGTGLNMQDYDDNDDGDDYDGTHGNLGKGMRIVPPHLLIHQRNTDKMVFSVCEGNGRTLKGRDLTVNRDSILRLTGFLEK
ncbi:hypothetical protein LUZ62_033757 [Rhynchospora pubera]|uniref:Uncharacterized protein n=1 Tax=Rhynchospora pubera TaxID=906938 RepID=A0AAV8DPD6_9POAL|nr:hypothetical protein LUZ62_078825 [Rhynchospora pubera]KAJ4821191.1 hypothetical protein LUZ62_033757 [Rhynchospora pubera]